MTKELPKELANARELIDQVKLDEALEIVENFEKGESLSPENQLSALLIKAKIYDYNQQFEKCVKVSEHAYQISQDLGYVSETVEALIWKSGIVFTGDLDKAEAYVIDAEKRLKSLADNASKRILNRELLLIKSWILFFKGNLNRAEELAQENLKLTIEQKIGNKFDLALNYSTLGWINAYQGNRTTALDCAMKSLKLNKELNHNIAVASNYSLITSIYFFEGDYDQALQFCKQSLAIKEITYLTRLDVLKIIARIYHFKGKFNRAIKYSQQSVALAEELNIADRLIEPLLNLGYFHRIMGNNDQAIEYYKRGLILAEKRGITFLMGQLLGNLVWTYIDLNSREIATRYFSRLTDLYNQTKDKRDIDISLFYLGSKAYMMKTSTRMRDRVEAQAIFKELIDRSGGENLILFMGNLCDLLFEELLLYNDPGILDEIKPLIIKCLNMAEETRNYYWLAETKLLQAKLALIQTNIEEAKRLMVHGQHIADLHGLNLLAWRISSEHDNLLDQIDLWDKVKKEEAPISERIKFASTNKVLERMQGKRAVEPPELVDEEPILLLIMDNSGVPYFNHSFVSDWDIDGIFSSFMSAFNTFSSELFSKTIDRIRIGENTILINPLESFLTCYVIKGQSYPALQKLSRFTEAIRENSEIWQALNKSVKTSEMLKLDKFSALKTVIDEIF